MIGVTKVKEEIKNFFKKKFKKKSEIKRLG